MEDEYKKIYEALHLLLQAKDCVLRAKSCFDLGINTAGIETEINRLNGILEEDEVLNGDERFKDQISYSERGLRRSMSSYAEQFYPCYPKNPSTDYRFLERDDYDGKVYCFSCDKYGNIISQTDPSHDELLIYEDYERKYELYEERKNELERILNTVNIDDLIKRHAKISLDDNPENENFKKIGIEVLKVTLKNRILETLKQNNYATSKQ